MPTETVLVTGASSGIGLELARCFAAGKANLVLVARREAKLRALAEELQAAHGIQAKIVVKDLAQPEAVRELVEQLEAEGIQIDVLVNNAGFGEGGAIAEIPLERQLNMVRVNVLALVELTRRLLPGLIARRRVGVLNVGSTAGFQPGPYLGIYYATKAFVLHFSEALAVELKGKGVSVTCLCPGPTATEFAAQSNTEKIWLFRLGTMSAARVARSGYHGFRKGRVSVIPGIGPKLLAFAVRFTPRFLVRRVTSILNR